MPTEPTEEQIAKRAYEFFLARGCEHGKDVDDWLAAEKELRDVIFESDLAVASETQAAQSNLVNLWLDLPAEDTTTTRADGDVVLNSTGRARAEWRRHPK